MIKALLVWEGVIRGTFNLGWSDQGHFWSGTVKSGAFLFWDGVIRGIFGLERCDQVHF